MAPNKGRRRKDADAAVNKHLESDPAASDVQCEVGQNETPVEGSNSSTNDGNLPWWSHEEESSDGLDARSPASNKKMWRAKDSEAQIASKAAARPAAELQHTKELMLSVRHWLAKATAQSDVDAQSSMETASGDSRSQPQSAASTEPEVTQDTEAVTVSPPSASQPLPEDRATLSDEIPSADESDPGALGPDINGSWMGAATELVNTINGNTLTWHDGVVTQIRLKNARSFEMEFQGMTYTGELRDDGRIHCDGGMWIRCEASASTGVQACTEKDSTSEEKLLCDAAEAPDPQIAEEAKPTTTKKPLGTLDANGSCKEKPIALDKPPGNFEVAKAQQSVKDSSTPSHSSPGQLMKGFSFSSEAVEFVPVSPVSTKAPAKTAAKAKAAGRSSLNARAPVFMPSDSLTAAQRLRIHVEAAMAATPAANPVKAEAAAKIDAASANTQATSSPLPTTPSPAKVFTSCTASLGTNDMPPSPERSSRTAAQSSQPRQATLASCNLLETQDLAADNPMIEGQRLPIVMAMDSRELIADRFRSVGRRLRMSEYSDEEDFGDVACMRGYDSEDSNSVDDPDRCPNSSSSTVPAITSAGLQLATWSALRSGQLLRSIRSSGRVQLLLFFLFLVSLARRAALASARLRGRK